MRMAVSAVLLAAAIATPLGIVGIWANPLASEKTTNSGAKGPPITVQSTEVVPNADEWNATTLMHDPVTGQPWAYVSPKETGIHFLRDECLGSKLNQDAAATTIRGYLAAHEAELDNPIRRESPPVFLNCFEDAQGSLKLVVGLAGLPIEVQVPDACGDALEANAALGVKTLQFPGGCEPPMVSDSLPQMIQIPADVREVTQP